MCALLLCGCPRSAAPPQRLLSDPLDPLVVETEAGPVRGRYSGDTMVFKGIPFAAPPVGILRWRPPREVAPWKGVRDAGQFGAACPQLDNGKVIGSEDCLTLNIWTPVKRSGPLPVFVFLHGGSNEGSSASQIERWDHVVPGIELPRPPILAWEGSRLAFGGRMIVVTIQFRLGALGSLALPDLDDESHVGLPGNHALTDQLAALQWVKRNIARFGGDPSRITAGGHSSGASDVCALLGSPYAKGVLFAAVLQSGRCALPNAQKAVDAAEGLVTRLGCSGKDVGVCLRTKTAEQVVAAAKPGAFRPFLDGWIVPTHPVEAIAAARHGEVAIMVGSTADEMTTLIDAIGGSGVGDAEDYQRFVASRLGKYAAPVLAQYPAAAFESPRHALVALETDRGFTCTARAIARGASRHSNARVYRYFFSRRMPQGPLLPIRAAHGLELPFVFGHIDHPWYQSQVADRQLSATMAGYWSRFVSTGDPNGSGLSGLPWPRYQAAKDPVLVLDAPPHVTAGVRNAECDFWAKLAVE